MIKNSIIISFIVKICLEIQTAYENSGFYKLYKKVSDFFGRLWSGSGVYAFFSQKRRNTSGSHLESNINGFMEVFYNVFHNLFTKIGGDVSCSTCGSLFMFLIKNWQYVSVRYYSVAMFVYTIVRLAASKIAGIIVGRYTLAIGVLSCIGMLIDVSPAGLYMGSDLKRQIGLPELEGKQNIKVDFKPYVAVTVSIIIGSIFGVCSVIPMWYLLMLALIIVPLVIARPQIGVYIAIVSFPFVPGGVSLGLSVLTLFGMLVTYIVKEREKVRFDMFDLSVLMMLIAILFGTVNSYATEGGAGMTLAFAGMVFAIRRCIDKRAFLYATINSVIAVAFFMSMYGIYKNIIGQAMMALGSEKAFGEYLIITISLTFAAIIGTTNKNSKKAFWVAFAVQLVCLVLLDEKSSILAVMISLGIMLAINFKRLFSAIILGVLGFSLVCPSVVAETVNAISGVLQSRLPIWQGSAGILKDFWLTGIGHGQSAFENIYPLYMVNGVASLQPCSLYLAIMCEMGVVGLVAFVLLVINFFRNTVSVLNADIRMKPLALGLTSAMISLLTYGIFNTVWYGTKMYMFFFIMIAISAAMRTVLQKETA